MKKVTSDSSDTNVSSETITKEAKQLRRKMLKSLAGSSSVVAGGVMTWKAPIIDDILLPAHATTSPSITLQVTVGDDVAADDESDGPDASDGSRTFDPGSYTFPSVDEDAGSGDSDNNDDSFEQVLMTVTVNPPSAVEVSASFTQDYTNDAADGDIDLDSSTKTTSATDGQTSFVIQTDNSDDDEDINPSDSSGSLNLMVSAPGFGSSEVTINFVED